MSDQQVILHWYPESPFAQKVVWALQYKKIDFKLVHISRIEPRLDRRPLDAGYRKTPVLQIGNHTWCDSKAIFAELEKRYPEPSLYPKGPQGESTEIQAISIGRWVDGVLFLGVASQLPDIVLRDEAFRKDRSEFSGRPLDANKMKFVAPFMQQSLKAEFSLAEKFINERNSAGSLYALGTEKLSLVDLHFGMVTWFAKMLIGADWIKTNIPSLGAHLEKISETVFSDNLQNVEIIEAKKALELAKDQSQELNDASHDGSLNIKLGANVMVTPTDTGATPSFGKLVSSTINETVIVNEREGFTAYTHFPTLGFVVLPDLTKPSNL